MYLCSYSSGLRHNLSGLLVTNLSSCHTFIPFCRVWFKDVQSKSFCRQMVWSLLHEGCPILIVRTDVIFIFLHYLPAPIICCSYILQPCLMSEGEHRDIHLEEWLFSHCQCFPLRAAVLILNRGPLSIVKLAQRCHMHVEYVANLTTSHLQCGIKVLQCLWIITSANFRASGCILKLFILLHCLHNCTA